MNALNDLFDPTSLALKIICDFLFFKAWVDNLWLRRVEFQQLFVLLHFIMTFLQHEILVQNLRQKAAAAPLINLQSLKKIFAQLLSLAKISFEGPCWWPRGNVRDSQPQQLQVRIPVNDDCKRWKDRTRLESQYCILKLGLLGLGSTYSEDTTNLPKNKVFSTKSCFKE